MNKTEKGNSQRLARAFFGRDSCVRFEHADATWMMVGKKHGHGEWQWQKAKLNPEEVGEIIAVMSGRIDKAGFFHTFDKDGVKKETRINISKTDDSPNIFFRIDELAKPLDIGEQEVLKALLQRVLYECEDDWQPDAARGDAV